MKNWKKLISGVVAMMTVATVASAAPAKLPVEVLDVADATGIEIQSYIVDNGDGTETEYAYDGAYTQAAADNEGTWSLTTGSNTSNGNVWCGKVYTNGNGVTVYRGTGTRHRQLSAGYTTNKTYDYADTMVQFSFGADNFDDGRSQIIQVSSDEIMESQPVYANFEDETVNPGASYFNYNYDGAVIRVSADGIQYLDPEKNELVTVDINLDKNKIYSFRIVRVSGADTYDLYVDDVKIGVNSEPVATDIPLVAPKGNSINTVKMWVGGSTVAPYNYKASLSDIRFMQSKPVTIAETFDKIPANGSIGTTVALNESFDYADLAEMQAAGWNVTEPTTDITATAEITGGKFKTHMNKALASSQQDFITAERELEGEEKGILTLTAGLGLDETGSKYTNSNASIYFIGENEDDIKGYVMLQSGHAIGPATTAFVLGVGDAQQLISSESYAAIGGAVETGDTALKGTICNGTIYNIKLVSDKMNNTVKLYADGVDEPIITIDGACISGVKKIKLSHMQQSYRKGWATNSAAYFDYVKLAYSGEGWDYYEAKGHGSVTGDGSLKLAYSESKDTKRSVNAWYTNAGLASLDEYEMSFEFTPDYDSTGVAEAVMLVGDNGKASTATNTPTGMTAYENSIQLVMSGDKLYYGDTDESGNSYKIVPGFENVTANGTTYYVKVAVNNVDKTYSLYISTSPVSIDAEPVIKDSGFFCPTEGAALPQQLGFLVQKIASVAVKGNLTVDNLIVIHTAFAVMNDDQQYMTALGTSQYIDLINVPADKEVIVAYYDADNKLVDVAVATADTLRAKKTDDTAVSALVMTWDDFDNIVPAGAAIELK